jgi:molybdenum cofactor cytidylyltransferase
MELARALRIKQSTSQTLAFVGAGGKTSALFQLAQELSPSAIVVATTHLGAWQTALADCHIVANNASALNNISPRGVTLVTGAIENDRTKSINQITLNWIHETARSKNAPLFVEADGARQKPLKAPAAHEPPIPEFADIVIVVAGLSALGKPLTDAHVHRAKIFSQLSGLPINQPITADAIARVLAHPQGGLKNIPSNARRVALLNQTDTLTWQSIGGDMARSLLNYFDAVLVGSMERKSFQTFERCAGIILAAGESKRFGETKQLLDWNGKPFVRHVAETTLHAGLEPVLVVVGFHAAEIESALNGLPVRIIHNPDYREGQATSIRAGINATPKNIGAAVFLLADQPQIPAEVIRALGEAHTQSLSPILAPLVLEERRANPVLFDRVTFPDLMQLTGDVGGRAIFDKQRVEYIPWHDESLLFDVDAPEDYARLKEL